jgi:Trypsin-co-occurring domain 1
VRTPPGDRDARHRPQNFDLIHVRVVRLALRRDVLGEVRGDGLESFLCRSASTGQVRGGPSDIARTTGAVGGFAGVMYFWQRKWFGFLRLLPRGSWLAFYDMPRCSGEGWVMAVPIEVQVGRTRVLVQALPAAGTELTSGKADQAAEHVLGAFERAQDAIVEVAASTIHTIERTAQRAARPDRLELEFGISFSA